jgi:hypothetical protein
MLTKARCSLELMSKLSDEGREQVQKEFTEELLDLRASIDILLGDGEVVEPNLSNETASKGGGHKNVTTPPDLVDDTLLERLQPMAAYAHLNVRAVYEKFLLHCEVKGKPATRGFFLNFLNRERPGPVVQPAGPTDPSPPVAASRNGTWRGRAVALLEDLYEANRRKDIASTILDLKVAVRTSGIGQQEFEQRLEGIRVEGIRARLR